MRVLLVDPRDRVLLFRDSDLGLDPVAHWWMTPGGGVDPGETDVGAALREVAEETGFRLTADDLVGPLARRTVVHGYSDVVVEQEEVFWSARTPHDRISTAGHTAEEQQSLAGHRWWTRAELEAHAADAAAEPLWPGRLAELLDLAASWVPGLEPADLGTVEESTVPT
ncbi:NUDIX domain-containing protein [Nocardioidaceae bacterium]|nr:NUDIX domain-containing protein [Nocardioidaceae bacterium]